MSERIRTKEEIEEMYANPMFHFLCFIERIKNGEITPEEDPKRFDADYNRVFCNYPKDSILRHVSYGFVAGFDAAMKLCDEVIKELEDTATTTETTK